MKDKNIYSLEDFIKYLSELPIGTEQAQKLTNYVELKHRQIEFMSERLDTASQIIGNQLITDYMNEG